MATCHLILGLLAFICCLATDDQTPADSPAGSGVAYTPGAWYSAEGKPPEFGLRLVYKAREVSTSLIKNPMPRKEQS
jgi:hypothetical protein